MGVLEGWNLCPSVRPFVQPIDRHTRLLSAIPPFRPTDRPIVRPTDRPSARRTVRPPIGLSDRPSGEARQKQGKAQRRRKRETKKNEEKHRNTTKKRDMTSKRKRTEGKRTMLQLHVGGCQSWVPEIVEMGVIQKASMIVGARLARMRDGSARGRCQKLEDDELMLLLMPCQCG